MLYTLKILDWRKNRSCRRYRYSGIPCSRVAIFWPPNWVICKWKSGSHGMSALISSSSRDLMNRFCHDPRILASSTWTSPKYCLPCWRRRNTCWLYRLLAVYPVICSSCQSHCSHSMATEMPTGNVAYGSSRLGSSTMASAPENVPQLSFN